MILELADWVRLHLIDNIDDNKKSSSKLSDDKLQKELSRLEMMKEYEHKFSGSIIAGIDEAGRGPLFGPVVAGCVVLDLKEDILFINDSKKLSEKKRNLLYDEIKQKALAYGIGIVDNVTIDKINILEATHLAMKEAFDNCDKMYFDKHGKHISLLLVDALHVKNIDTKQVAIIHGDQLSISIAAASILAKVTRDNLMIEMDKEYPSYGIAKHKGYGTKQHIEALKKYGATPLHRKTFITKFVNE